MLAAKLVGWHCPFGVKSRHSALRYQYNWCGWLIGFDLPGFTLTLWELWVQPSSGHLTLPCGRCLAVQRKYAFNISVPTCNSALPGILVM